MVTNCHHVAHVKQYYSPEATSCLFTNSHEETISSTCLLHTQDVISHEDVKDFQLAALTPSHMCRPGRPAGKKVLSPSSK